MLSIHDHQGASAHAGELLYFRQSGVQPLIPQLSSLVLHGQDLTQPPGLTDSGALDHLLQLPACSMQHEADIWVAVLAQMQSAACRCHTQMP